MPRPFFRFDFMDLPKRKSPRIPNYDYSLPNYYFITICTHNKVCHFGDIGHLNVFGKYAEECILKIHDLYPEIRIDKYVIMPNHIHAIFVFESNNGHSVDLSHVIGQYKMAVTKRIHRFKPELTVWQRSFYDHIIRNRHSYEEIWKYIEDNPRKWEGDCFYMAEQ